jgi:hypothetical protein
MKEIFNDVIGKRKEHILHLSLLWRFLLFPIMIPWFLFQLFALSFFCGMALMMIALFSFLIIMGSKDWKEECKDSLGMFFLPIIAPIIWWIRYFKYGEYVTLFDE